jgi:hypothetical protein
MTFTYTQNTPNANDTVAKTQPIIKNNFNYLRTWALLDHRFSAATTDVLTGAHNKITFPATMAAPGIGTAFAVLYPSNGSGFDGVALQNAAGSFDITGRNPSVPAAPAQIETCLPGKVLMKSGIINVSMVDGTTGSGTVNFTPAFPTDVRSIQLTPINVGSSPNPLQNKTSLSFGVNSVTTASFGYSWVNVAVSGVGSPFSGFYWTAIGTSI